MKSSLRNIRQAPLGKDSPSDLLLLTNWQADILYVVIPQTKNPEKLPSNISTPFDVNSCLPISRKEEVRG